MVGAVIILENVEQCCQIADVRYTVGIFVSANHVTFENSMQKFDCNVGCMPRIVVQLKAYSVCIIPFNTSKQIVSENSTIMNGMYDNGSCFFIPVHMPHQEVT